MKAETIAIGTELLIGQIANTNAQYLSQELNALGIGVYYHTVVGDNLDRILDTLRLSLSRSDFIFITGGLGPTEDDITRESLAVFAGVRLLENTQARKSIEKFFELRGVNMPASNYKQALIPEGATILENDKGTAPGFILPVNGKHFVVLPGPPVEMKHLFQSKVLPALFPQINSSIHSKFLKVFNMGESLVEERILDLVEGQTSPTIATYAKEGDVTIRLTVNTQLHAASKSPDKAGKPSSFNEVDEMAHSNDSLFEPVLSEILNRLGSHVYSTENENLDAVTAKLLLKHGIKIATVESCTGGMISASLTNISGISSVFLGGLVTYSNESKEKFVHVRKETLEKHGAVSCETALEMAEGARKAMGSDIAISVTGIAGPDGGSQEKPVGLVYIGLSSAAENSYKELRLTGGRDRIRRLTTLHALDYVRRFILAKHPE